MHIMMRNEHWKFESLPTISISSAPPTNCLVFEIAATPAPVVAATATAISPLVVDDQHCCVNAIMLAAATH